MPSNVSKLWFQRNDFDESSRQRPDTPSGKSLNANSNRIDDFPSESKYNRYRHHHTTNGDRARTLDSSSYASVSSLSNSVSSEYREHDRRPTHLKSRRERDNRSKSLKIARDSHGSSGSRDDNWILQRPEKESSSTSSAHHSSPRRPHVSKIFSNLDYDKNKEHLESPFYQNNKHPQIKYNTLYKDTSAPSRRNMVDIQVAPQTPSKGKQLKVSDESNKYTIQIGSRAMTIEGVTLHKPNHITQV